MFTDDFYRIIEKVEKSYKGFNVFKDGSVFDKLLCVALWVGYILISVVLFYFNVFTESIIWKICSLVVFFLCFVFLYNYRLKIQRRENFFYKKGQKNEEEFLNQFIHNLSRNKINVQSYPKIITYFRNKKEKESNKQESNIEKYLSIVLIPVIIAIFSKDEFLSSYLLAFSVIGIIIISLCIQIFSLIINRKINMYENIAYYLNLYLLISEKQEN